MYLTYTICAKYHNTTKVAYCVHFLHHKLQFIEYYQGVGIFCTLPTQYAPIIRILLRQYIMYLTYIICTKCYNTANVAYCATYLHNMLPLLLYYQGITMYTLPTQNAPNIIILPRRGHILYLTYTICSKYHNTTKVEYCVPYLHNMLQISKYY